MNKMKKNKIDFLLQKLLKEQREDTDNVKSIESQTEILQTAKQYCYSNVFGDIKSLESSVVSSSFPELSKFTPLVYVSVKDEKNKNIKYMYFGIVDENAKDTSGSVGYLGYKVEVDKRPIRFRNGWGLRCSQLQKVESLGPERLPQEYERTLNAFLERNPGFYSKFNPNSSEYSKINLVDLIDPQTNEKVLPDYKGEGYIWKRNRLSFQDIDVFEGLDKMLETNNLTRKRPTNVGSDEFNFPLLLSDLTQDIKGLENNNESYKSTIVWPIKLQEPNRQTCKTSIEKLIACKKSNTKLGCMEKLFENKINAIMCGDKKIVQRDLFGIKKEYDELITDKGTFGLSKIIEARNQGINRSKKENKTSNNINENFNKIVLKHLKEEYKRRGL